MKALPAGVTVALATPLGPDGSLDEAGLDRLVSRVLDAGVVGISPLGSTGEGARLSMTTRHRVVAGVRSRVPAGFPVIAGLPVTTLDAARTELAELAESGADAALVAAPSYYPATDSDVENLYTSLAEDSPLPLVVYNIPSMTGVRVAPEVLGTLARHPGIIGIKDSSRDLEYLQAALIACEGADFTVLTGSDSMLLASLMIGAAGTIAASANLVADMGVQVYEAVRRGDYAAAREAQQRLFAVVMACRRGTPPGGWKAALEIAGVCSGRLAAPASRLPDEIYKQIEDDLARLLPAGV